MQVVPMAHYFYEVTPKTAENECFMSWLEIRLVSTNRTPPNLPMTVQPVPKIAKPKSSPFHPIPQKMETTFHYRGWLWRGSLSRNKVRPQISYPKQKGKRNRTTCQPLRIVIVGKYFDRKALTRVRDAGFKKPYCLLTTTTTTEETNNGIGNGMAQEVSSAIRKPLEKARSHKFHT